ncbi:hypothetical protein WEH80_38535 [Actinomycetes bacterium KLBMP 9759]
MGDVTPQPGPRPDVGRSHRLSPRDPRAAARAAAGIADLRSEADAVAAEVATLLAASHVGAVEAWRAGRRARKLGRSLRILGRRFHGGPGVSTAATLATTLGRQVPALADPLAWYSPQWWVGPPSGLTTRVEALRTNLVRHVNMIAVDDRSKAARRDQPRA